MFGSVEQLLENCYSNVCIISGLGRVKTVSGPNAVTRTGLGGRAARSLNTFHLNFHFKENTWRRYSAFSV